MFSTILAAIFILAGVAMFAVATGKAKKLGFVPILLGLAIVAMSCTTIIQAKNVGVLTTFGKPTDSLNAGLHLKAPWQKVTELDGTKITNKYTGSEMIQVRIGDGTTANVETALRWQIVGDKAANIYADYRSDDVNQNLRDALVETVFKNAINSVFGQYNPTADLVAVEGKDAGKVNFVPDYDGLAKQVTESMKERVAESGA